MRGLVPAEALYCPIPLNWSNNGLSDIRLNRVYPSLGRGRARAKVAAINYPSISVSLGRSWWSPDDDTEWTIQTQLQVRDGPCQPRWSMARKFPHTAYDYDEKSPNLSQCCSISTCTFYTLYMVYKIKVININSVTGKFDNCNGLNNQWLVQ